MITVEWTGEWPNLCRGNWRIFKNNKNVSEYIPEELKIQPMETRKTYSFWSFDDNYSVEWEDQIQGLSEKEWIKKNNFWIKNFCENENEKKELFQAIQEKDWRQGTCGGCI